MMISKKYINHDQLNKEKFVLLLVKPNGGFMALFFYLHTWRCCIIRYRNRRNSGQKYDFRRCIEDGYPSYIIAQYLLNTAEATIRIRISSVNDIFDQIKSLHNRVLNHFQLFIDQGRPSVK